MPNGISGVITGAAKLYFLFGSFEVICTASEECKDPIRSLPIALVLCIVIYAVFSAIMAMCLTLIVPWKNINEFSPIPDAFLQHGDTFPSYLSTVGVLLGILGCGLTSYYGATRLAYSIALDKLIFSFLAYLSSNKVPVISVVIIGIISFILAVFIPLESLIDLLNIGSISCYIAVSALVVILRYRPIEENFIFFQLPDSKELKSKKSNEEPVIGGTLKTQFECFSCLRSKKPGRVVVISLIMYILCCLCFSIVVFHTEINDVFSMLLIAVFALGAVVSVAIICMHHQNDDEPPYKVPCVPFVPTLSILCNMSLLVNIPSKSFYRFFIWILIGLVIYFSYGYRHSTTADVQNDTKPDRSPLLKDIDENIDFGSTQMVVLGAPQNTNNKG
ncbi:high affinity cationic amino acid transporter 1-like [Antedon mediterranea]|uniref:high affinity cationic amino acid transporter 1-like n=1 Tax=Antedon mediterranea TaxID=105859 RepID=UPI003AF795C0